MRRKGPARASLCFATPQGAQGREGTLWLAGQTCQGEGRGLWRLAGPRCQGGGRDQKRNALTLQPFACFCLPLRKSWPEGDSDCRFFLRGRRKKRSLCNRFLVFVLPLRKSSAKGASDENAEAPSAELFLRGRTKQANGCRVSAFHSCNLFLNRISGPPSDAEA